MSIKEVWEEYKKQHDGQFTENAIGYHAVSQFLSTAYDTHILSVKEKFIAQTTKENSIIEESEAIITCKSGDNHIEVVTPTITYASFENDKISSIHIYWDQASVLKEFKLVPDKKPDEPERLAAGVNEMDLNHQQGRRPVHTTSRVNQPGGTGGRSSIFSDMSDPNEDSTRRFNRAPVKNSLFGETDQSDNRQQGRRSVHTSSRVNQPGGTGGRSTIFSDMIDPSEDSRQQSITGSTRRRGKSQFESSVEFGDDGDNPPQQRSSSRTSSRVLKPPGGGSSNIFG